MNKQYVEDNEIGMKYLRKQLNAEQVEAFEIYLMENPDYLDEIELNSILDGTLVVEDNTIEYDIKSSPGSFSYGNKKVTSLKWLTSVSVAFVFGFIANYITFSRGFADVDLESAQIQYASIVRSGGDQNISAFFRRSSELAGQEFVLVLELGAANGDMYSIAIEGDEEINFRRIVEYKSLKVSPDGTLAMLLPQKDYDAGVYQIIATKHLKEDKKEESRFFMKIKK